jgi:hypothetical protein
MGRKQPLVCVPGKGRVLLNLRWQFGHLQNV